MADNVDFVTATGITYRRTYNPTDTNVAYDEYINKGIAATPEYKDYVQAVAEEKLAQAAGLDQKPASLTIMLA